MRDRQRDCAVGTVEPEDWSGRSLAIKQRRQGRDVGCEGNRPHRRRGIECGVFRPGQNDAAAAGFTRRTVEHCHGKAMRWGNAQQMSLGLQAKRLIQLIGLSLRQRAVAAEHRTGRQNAQHGADRMLVEPVVQASDLIGCKLAGAQNYRTIAARIGDDAAPDAAGAVHNSQNIRIRWWRRCFFHYCSRYSMIRTGTVERSTTAIISTSRPEAKDRPREVTVKTLLIVSNRWPIARSASVGMLGMLFRSTRLVMPSGRLARM